MFVRRTLSLLILAVLTANVASAAVEYIGLQTYVSQIPEEGYQVGDKIFSNFQVFPSASNNGNAPDASSITITGVRVDWDDSGPGGWEYGILINGAWSAIGRQLVDTFLVYKVSVSDPSMYITGNTLKIGGVGAGAGGQVTVTESVMGSYPGGEEYGYEYVYQHGNVRHLMEHMDFESPHREIWVEKDIAVNGGVNIDGSASLSAIYQTFSQAPEPCTMALLAIGGIAALARRGKK